MLAHLTRAPMARLSMRAVHCRSFSSAALRVSTRPMQMQRHTLPGTTAYTQRTSSSSDAKKDQVAEAVPQRAVQAEDVLNSASPSASEVNVLKPKEVKTVEPKSNDDRIDKRVWPIALSSLMMGTAIGVIIPIMPMFARDLGLSSLQYGSVVSVLGLTRLAMNIPASWAAERYGRKPLLILGPAITSVAMTATAAVSSLQGLLAMRFMTGVGGSMQMGGAQLFVSDISTSRNRARTMAPMMAAFAAGATLGPALGGFLAERFGLRLPFVVVGLTISAVVINNYLRVQETKPPVPAAKGKDTSLVMEFRETAKQWKPLLKNADMQCILFTHGTYWMATSGCMLTLMPLMAMDQFALSPGAIGTLFASMSVINVVGSQPAAWVSDKIGRKVSVLTASTMLIAALSLIPFASTMNQFYGLIGVWALGSTIQGTTPTSYVADISTDETRGQALALLRSAGDVGLMFGAACTGFISDMAGTDMAMWSMGALLLSSGINFAMRAQESINRETDSAFDRAIKSSTKTEDVKVEDVTEVKVEEVKTEVKK